MLRVGIVGTNFISDWFVAAARRTNGRISPVAVYSRTDEGAQAFARKHGLQRAFSDYASMLGEVDAVYIASPTIAHYPQAMAAIEAGRHVLVEKTMTSSAAEAEDLFAAAERQGVVLMEATRHLHTPTHRFIRETVERLGALRYAHIEKLQYSSRYDRFRAGEAINAFDPTLGNSSLADIGVYCLQPALDFFGTPLDHTGHSVRLSNGFEAAGSIQLNYGSLIADVVYSKVVMGVGPSTIIGEDATLAINDSAEPSHIVLLERKGTSQVLLDIDEVKPVDTMHHELIAFAEQVEAGAIAARWKNLTIATRRIMDEHLARV